VQEPTFMTAERAHQEMYKQEAPPK